MATIATIAATQAAQPQTASVRRATGLLLIAQCILMYATLGILAPTINWPASLDEPAAVMLPLLLEQRAAVAAGYTSYFVSALLLIPIALLLEHVLDGSNRALLRVSAGLGVLAGLAKMLGIGRWLLLMPALASTFTDPQTTAPAREAIAVVFAAFNTYAGGVGEVLGVALLSGLWTALVSLALLRSRRFPRWLGGGGLVAAALLLLGVLELYGIDLGPILIVQGVIWQFWMLALGIVLLRVPRKQRL
jgi:hypothetical protein